MSNVNDDISKINSQPAPGGTTVGGVLAKMDTSEPGLIAVLLKRCEELEKQNYQLHAELKQQPLLMNYVQEVVAFHRNTLVPLVAAVEKMLDQSQTSPEVEGARAFLQRVKARALHHNAEHWAQLAEKRREEETKKLQVKGR